MIEGCNTETKIRFSLRATTRSNDTGLLLNKQL